MSELEAVDPAAQSKSAWFVIYKDVEHKLVSELTQREIFEAETIAGKTFNQIPGFTAGMLMAWFTLRRAGVRITWDDLINKDGIVEIVEREPIPPTTEPNGGSESQDRITALDGNQDSPTSLDSSPGT